ncbi:MAG: ABC transporter ATP-binding protein [Bacteroidota bacterium]|mgnify:CR=1 FL=1|jgi:ABC-2 type transport system ATP-binding protein
MTIVETQGLSKTFRAGVFKKGQIEALRDVSLSVEAGEIFGLLGPNGAGKTTFVKILLSISHPTIGVARVFGHKLGALSIRQKSGYLPENHRYPQFLTGLQTLLLFGNLHGLKGPILKGKAQSLLQRVGLKDWMNIKIKRYSKGMLQRLGMAQALLNDPELLFLDEPTDGVDPVGRKEIRDVLKGLKAHGATIFLNSHLLSEVELICDRVAILNKGQVLRVGTISEITAPQLEYEIQLESAISERLSETIRSIVREAHANDRVLRVAVPDKHVLNHVLDAIRKEGILIESVVPRRASLEDYFIKVLQSGEGT